MLSFVLLLIVNALVINGVWFVTSPGQIASPVGRLIETRLPQWVAKPTVQCRACMSSFWGSVIFLSFGHFHFGLPLWEWPAYCLALCGMITFLQSFAE
jgi:hypothetical protein